MERIKVVLGLFVLAVVLSLSSDANAQRRMISSREWMLPLSNPTVKFWEKSRRVEMTDETLANGAIVKSVLTINEVFLPDHSRYYRKEITDGVTTEFEQIKIGYMQYTRKNSEPWTKVDLRGSGTGSGNGTGGGVSTRCDQFSVEDVILNGKQVQLYEMLSINSDTNELTFTESRRWIASDGLLHRQEYVSGKLSPREETIRTVTTYEYDPNIKIEAPIK